MDATCSFNGYYLLPQWMPLAPSVNTKLPSRGAGGVLSNGVLLQAA